MKTRIKRRALADIDPAYLEWIRTLPCVVCQRREHGTGRFLPVLQLGPTESAHIVDRGLGQKCPDRETIPLCVAHHRTGRHAHHKLGKRFWQHHGIDRDALLVELNTRYELELNGVAR